MSHWAEIDETNIVLRVVVGDNNDPNGDEGYKTISECLGGTWIKTSYNGNIRKNFAGVGYTYDTNLDAFLAPKPEPFEEDGVQFDWLLNTETCRWEEYQVI
jgi:hypothetical protein